MSIYTTPLQFGYFFSLVLWLALLFRGYKEHRLSDVLLGWIMFLLAMEMQDYTFGFAGINVLWNELNGFPRSVSLLFGPVVYFYFKAQTNRYFTIKAREFLHFSPYLVAFLYQFVFFVQGAQAVEKLQDSDIDLVMGYINKSAILISYSYYFYQCLKIYKDYRNWSQNQFSDTDVIAFSWFRNFVYAMISWILFREVMNIIDVIYDLDFYNDWWWHLALVAVSVYIGLKGLSQKQPSIIGYSAKERSIETSDIKSAKTGSKEANNDRLELVKKLNAVMLSERLYLQPELNLSDLAKHLKTNTSLLSASINQELSQNFNDYINSLRVDEFIAQYNNDESRNYTMLSLALDAGFNSKATFNRAFKKIKGTTPKEYFEKAQA